MLGKSIPLTLVDSDKVYLYKRDTSTNGLSTQSASPSDLLMSIQSNETYESLDRSYASSTTPWGGAPAVDGPTRLQGSVYPDAQVQAVPVDGGMLMTFLTDDASRGDDNRTMLVWSRYDENSKTWSEPQPVWQDGTADFTPSLCSDGSGGAWVAWSNARQAVRDGLTLSEESALLDVAVARFDPNSRAMVGAEFVTNDDTAYEAAPRMGVCGGTPVLAWTRNSLDDVIGANGGCDVVVATRSGGAWAPSAVATASGMVTSLAAGGLGGVLAVAWADDADGSQETVGDSSVWAWSDGSGASALSWSDSWNPRFAESGGSSALTWCQGGTLMLTTDGYEATVTSLEGLPVTAYALTGDLAGDALLSYERFEGGSGNVYGLVCSGGGWSDEVALTSQGQSVTSWGACLSGGVPSVAYAASTESELSSKDAGIWAVGGTSLRACALDSAWYENGAVHATVTNRGPVALDSATVSVSEGGSVVASAACGATLAPGETGEVEVPLAEPTDGRAHTYQVSVAPGLADAKPLEVTVGTALLAMDTTHHIVDGKESFSTTVTNIGLATSEAGKVAFYDLDSGSTLCERPLSALAGGERGEVTYEADGMLYEFGVSNVGVRFVADDGTTLATDVARAWQGDVDNSFD
ncbi:MAG: hypothetical protein J6D54_03935, partial [Olsenella sp.]|nr:hypothetical protein [Olsenella sp.]